MKIKTKITDRCWSKVLIGSAFKEGGETYIKISECSDPNCFNVANGVLMNHDSPTVREIIHHEIPIDEVPSGSLFVSGGIHYIKLDSCFYQDVDYNAFNLQKNKAVKLVGSARFIYEN